MSHVWESAIKHARSKDGELPALFFPTQDQMADFLRSPLPKPVETLVRWVAVYKDVLVDGLATGPMKNTRDEATNAMVSKLLRLEIADDFTIISATFHDSY